MSSDQPDDAIAQSDELVALLSIYGEETVKYDAFSSPSSSSVSFLPSKGKLFVEAYSYSSFSGELLFGIASTTNPAIQTKIKYLSPITLEFFLPHNYPSVNPPEYSIYCNWLNDEQIISLASELDAIWDSVNNSVILYDWFDFLQNRSIEFLKLKSPMVFSQKVFSALTEYDVQRDIKEFSNSTHTCPVCFCDKAGSACIRLYRCQHVFCKSCVQNYLEVHIKDGNVSMLKCLTDKCDSEINQSIVRELVPTELFERYDRLLLQCGLDKMEDVVYCPRLTCNSPVIVEKGTNMGSCNFCHYVFCLNCKMVYHGINNCRLKIEEIKKLRDDYLSGKQEDKLAMEQKYGKKVFQSLIEETLCHDWLQNHSKSCPSCSTHTEKHGGCNKIACSRCNAYWCWICKKILPKNQPYSHFRDPNSKCFGALFRGMEEEGRDDNSDNDDDFF